jgi:hypothetical protein
VLPAGNGQTPSDSELMEPGAAVEDAGRSVQETDYKVPLFDVMHPVPLTAGLLQRKCTIKSEVHL